MYPKVSGLAAGSENYKWYSSLPLGLGSFVALTLCFASQHIIIIIIIYLFIYLFIYFVIDSVWKILDIPLYL
jgi:hypothetical protein